MMTVPLHGKNPAGRVALVDDADAELVAGYSWRPDWRRNTFYARAYVPGTLCRGTGQPGQQIYMHVLLTGRHGTDHRDGDGLNNQRSNLRPATVSQNNANARKHSRNGGGTPSSAFKGVADSGYGGWRAYIWDGRRQRNLGSFASEIDAAIAYDSAALALRGEYALLNFPA